MAPKKQKGAPASTAKVPPKKLTRAEKSVINKSTFQAASKAAHRAVLKEMVLDVVEPRPQDRIKPLLATGVRGAPVIYTDELGAQLFEYITNGLSMEKISRLDGMPSTSIMLRWIGNVNHPFSKLYLEAKQLLVALYEERMIEVAEEPLLGDITVARQAVTRDGDVVALKETRTSDNVARSELKFKAYMWTLSHLRPTKHGRNPDQSSGAANEQLKGLFDALKAGPAE